MYKTVPFSMCDDTEGTTDKAKISRTGQENKEAQHWQADASGTSVFVVFTSISKKQVDEDE
jgi:hypothetical protein